MGRPHAGEALGLGFDNGTEKRGQVHFPTYDFSCHPTEAMTMTTPQDAKLDGIVKTVVRVDFFKFLQG